MPELPEVEVTRRGIGAQLTGRRVTGVVVRNAALRYPVPGDLAARLTGLALEAVERRAKYLLLRMRHTGGTAGERAPAAHDGGARGERAPLGDRTLIVHLGMSGSLRVLPAGEPAGAHDHLDVLFDAHLLRLRDPRRFGAVLWHEGDISHHPLLARLGVEPLSGGFTAELLHGAAQGRRTAVKPLLMDQRLVVGVGNIYACESLFRAGIRPARAARRLTRADCRRLVTAVRETLEAAVDAGGSTLRDFTRSDGNPGHFQQQHFVYARAGEPCRVCGSAIRSLRQGQRSTFYCPTCQR
ncbi:MAG: bifunctional DNA-formamidopyrimidine glycosylase/DNA-(apurinic or apyrimidinic site) lyase [Betaproteobacteria bacterium]|nr:bifunctional DNA-formamidopyrimidine glycosylase/DNA-(apurinic or apyrimidinic site) lyase [Betaproteobacteria bacterium]